MNFIPRRGAGAVGDAGHRFNPRRQYGNIETENYIHETVMFLVNILEAQENCSMELNKLTVEFCKRGNTKPLKKVALGDSFEDRILSFCWQHPTIFKSTLIDKTRTVHLRPIKPEIDDELERTLEDRTIEFLVFRCSQFGPCQIPISKLMGNLYQAASDIRQHYNDYLRFYNFLRTRSDIFTLIDSETVALKTVYDKAVQKNTSLLKCDEYYLDERVLNCTRMVDRFEDGLEIVKSILNTKEIVAIDCEGVNLGAPNGYITLVQLAIVDDLPENPSDDEIVQAIKIYLFDVQEDDRLMHIVLKKLLRVPKITKIFQGVSSDATALYNRYKIITNSVFDTVIAHRHLYEGTKSDLYYLYEFYTGEGTNRMKKDIKKKYISNPRLWTIRPLDELYIYYAAFDVFALIRIYYKLKQQIDQKTYDDIHEKSTSTAKSAYRRSLPLLGTQLYARGYTMEQVHKEIGWPLDSDDEFFEETVKSATNRSTRSRRAPSNGKSNHQTNKYHKNFRNHDETGNGGSTSSQFKGTTYYSNSTNYYNGHGPRHSSYNQSHRPNQFAQNDRPHRPRVANHYAHQQPQTNATNHFNTTPQLQFNQYQQPHRNYYPHNQFRYSQPYQYQYQPPYQPNPQYNYQHNQFQQSYSDQQTTQQPHQPHQQKQNYQNRHQHHNGKRNAQN